MADLRVNDKELKDVRLVIFDRDGTLIDLYHYWAQMIAKRAELICQKYDLDEMHRSKLMFEMGIDEQAKRIRPEGPVGIKKREIVMQSAVNYLSRHGIQNATADCIEIFERVDKWSNDMLAQLIKPLAGAKELIDALVVRGCKTAIATTDKEKRARISMDFLALTDKLDYVVGADSVERSKPAPDMAELILKELKVNKSDAVMIGDAETDIKMGINAGLKASIAVCSGITSRERLQQLTDYIIDDISRIKVVGKDNL